MHLKKRLGSQRETLALGRTIARELLRTRQHQGAIVLALTGDLGAGKTTLIRGIARGLGIRGKIVSPTFLLVRAYPLRRRTFYHIDCYRLRRPEELERIGFRDIIGHPDHIVAIEWAEKIKGMLPKHAIRIALRDGKTPHERIIVLRQ